MPSLLDKTVIRGQQLTQIEKQSVNLEDHALQFASSSAAIRNQMANSITPRKKQASKQSIDPMKHTEKNSDKGILRSFLSLFQPNSVGVSNEQNSDLGASNEQKSDLGAPSEEKQPTVKSLFDPAINNAQKINTYLQAILTILNTINCKLKKVAFDQFDPSKESIFKKLVSTELLPVISVYYKDNKNNDKYTRGTITKIDFINRNIIISPTKSKFSSSSVDNQTLFLDNLCIKSDERIAIIFGKVMTSRGHQRDIKKHDSCQLQAEEKSQ